MLEKQYAQNLCIRVNLTSPFFLRWSLWGHSKSFHSLTTGKESGPKLPLWLSR
jgi:hypothetical protein